MYLVDTRAIKCVFINDKNRIEFNIKGYLPSPLTIKADSSATIIRYTKIVPTKDSFELYLNDSITSVALD